MSGLVHGSAPIARSVGFAPALSSDDARWQVLFLYLWRGHAEACKFEPYGEALAVFHTAARATFASASARARPKTARCRNW
jgi:hypothetical protein